MHYSGTWHVYADRMPGANHRLHVVGALTFDAAGWTVRLEDRGAVLVAAHDLRVDLLCTPPVTDPAPGDRVHATTVEVNKHLRMDNIDEAWSTVTFVPDVEGLGELTVDIETVH